MTNKSILFFLSILSFGLITTCSDKIETVKIRPMADSIGFAQYGWQTDSILNRINQSEENRLLTTLKQEEKDSSVEWKAVISPHDDHAYVGSLYPAILSKIKTNTIIIFGVAHKAAKLYLENQIIFDSYSKWYGAYGPINVSSIRQEIMSELPSGLFRVNDEMQRIEHSVEAVLPFLQHNNPNIEIISILVPYMSYDKMEEIAGQLAKAIQVVTRRKQWGWGKDYSFIISSDAVHYGDKDWGGKNYAPYGTDKAGFNRAVAHEIEIIDRCLLNSIERNKIKLFTDYTVKNENYREYKWTWCGRYSIPFGLLTIIELQELQNDNLTGELIGYATSADHIPISVTDLGMGVTAPATIHHWVGYAAIGYH